MKNSRAASSRVLSVTGKFSEFEVKLIRDYCKDLGISPSVLLRELALREVGTRTLGDVDPPTAMVKLFIETTRLFLMDRRTGPTLTPARFEELVKRIAPTFVNGEIE